ncbi:POT family-domain-containing protein [Fomitopsis betulina]|nr:POT family-domain-containing protein [Fomitopsis betulina]
MPGDATDAYAAEKLDSALADSPGEPKHQQQVHAVHSDDELPLKYPNNVVAQSEYFDHDLPIPSQEDLATLRRISEKIPIKVYTIAFVELVERLSFYGTTQVFVNFIQQPNPGTSTGKALHPSAADAQPGALGMGQQASTGLTTFNQFWVYVMPLFGAYVADTYWGRFKTIWISILTATVGHVILTASAAPSVIAVPHHAIAAFIIGLIIMGIGTGGSKPNLSPLVAEQIPPKMYVLTTKKGERVIVDPAVTTARVYNWYYLFINIGALSGQLSMAYAERYVGFYLSFLLPTILFTFTLPILFICRKWYSHTKPEGSVLGPATKLLLFGAANRFHWNPWRFWKQLQAGGFWEDLKPSKMDPALRPAWMMFDDAWVNEVGRGWKACGVFLWLPLWWITYNQINNNLTSQASTMALHGVPNDIVSNLDPFALIICIPSSTSSYTPRCARQASTSRRSKRSRLASGSAPRRWSGPPYCRRIFTRRAPAGATRQTARTWTSTCGRRRAHTCSLLSRRYSAPSRRSTMASPRRQRICGRSSLHSRCSCALFRLRFARRSTRWRRTRSWCGTMGSSPSSPRSAVPRSGSRSASSTSRRTSLTCSPRDT